MSNGHPRGAAAGHWRRSPLVSSFQCPPDRWQADLGWGWLCRRRRRGEPVCIRQPSLWFAARRTLRVPGCHSAWSGGVFPGPLTASRRMVLIQIHRPRSSGGQIASGRNRPCSDRECQTICVLSGSPGTPPRPTWVGHLLAGKAAYDAVSAVTGVPAVAGGVCSIRWNAAAASRGICTTATPHGLHRAGAGWPAESRPAALRLGRTAPPTP